MDNIMQVAPFNCDDDLISNIAFCEQNKADDETTMGTMYAVALVSKYVVNKNKKNNKNHLRNGQKARLQNRQTVLNIYVELGDI
jgi:hypothetical protein